MMQNIIFCFYPLDVSKLDLARFLWALNKENPIFLKTNFMYFGPSEKCSMTFWSLDGDSFVELMDIEII